MAVARPATDQDRLPWLDSKVRRRRRDPRLLLIALFALAAFLSVSGLSYWFGQRSVPDTGATAAAEQVDHSVSRELPPALIEPAVQEPPPEPVAAPPVRSVLEAEPQPAPRPEPRRQVERAKPKPKADSKAARPVVRKAAPAPRRRVVRPRRSGYWPTPATAVGLGRVIQIGVFSNPRRAHDAWQKTLRRYPQARGLPRINSSYVARNGRTYHRVQIMTTAPAQSQWMCRKMRADGRRCTVLGSSA